MVNITLPDGSVRAFEKPVSGAELAASIGPGLAKAALAVKIDGQMKDLALPIAKDAKVAIVTAKDPDALELIRHDAAHVLAQAVQEIFPGTQITFGPAIDNGFYYDFARKEPFTPEDFAKIEQRMREIVDRNLPSSAASGSATSSRPGSRSTAKASRPSGSTSCRKTRRSASTSRANG